MTPGIPIAEVIVLRTVGDVVVRSVKERRCSEIRFRIDRLTFRVYSSESSRWISAGGLVAG